MKKIFKDKKIYICFTFLILTIISFLLMAKVNINYSLADYLPSTTDTSKALKIMSNEFGDFSTLQIMVNDLDSSEADNLKEKIEDIKNVAMVSFDSSSEDYYKNNKALYLIFSEGVEYSDISKNIKNDLVLLMDNEYADYSYTLGGSIEERYKLMSSITTQMPYIIFFAILLAFIILIITSNSFIEPFIFLFSAGIAIIINLGTNAIFSSISYITNSIAAILQLALAMDYSIEILHTYHQECLKVNDNNIAMKKAIKKCLLPISSSAITTIAGLFALLFMSFKIGFDIGIVLMKGIVLSYLVALSLLPCLILYFDPLLKKSSKKAINLPEKLIIKIPNSKNLRYVVSVLGILLILLSALGSNIIVKYSYSDTSSINENIVENFGNNNTIMVMYENINDLDNDLNNEEMLINEIKEYEKENNIQILNNYTSLNNTVYEDYDIEKIVSKMNIKEEEAKELFIMYELYHDPSILKLSISDFLDYTIKLIKEDNDAKEFVNNDTKNIIEIIKYIYELLNSNNDALCFNNSLKNELLTNLIKISEDKINLLYANYEMDNGYISNENINFITLLNFLNDFANNNDLAYEYISNDELSYLQSFNLVFDLYKEKKEELENSYTLENLNNIFINSYDTSLSPLQLSSMYYKLKGNIPNDNSTLVLIEALNYLADNEFLNELNFKIVKGLYLIYNYYDYFSLDYDYISFINLINKMGKDYLNIDNILDKSVGKQIYALYYLSNNLTSNIKIKGIDFVNYVLSLENTDPLIASYIDNNIHNKLIDLKTLYLKFSNETKYNYKEFSYNINCLINNIKSDFLINEMNEDIISGVYIKYLLNSDFNYQSIKAIDLLDFINTNLNSNELLKLKVDDNNLELINDANNLLNKGLKQLKGKNYTRLLFNVNLSAQDDITYDFADFISLKAKEIYGSETFVAGEIMSNNDLKLAFSSDQIIINLITAIAIFLIVALTFRQLLIPLILVLIIEGSVWLMVSIFSIFNYKIFFMGYIVTTCIMMGATIDYAILLTNNYLRLRKENDKNEAIRKAIKISLPTIFTSGSILTLCAFEVYLITTQSSIKSVGILLSVGSLCSLILVLFLLPSILIILDKAIIKSTIHFKK